MISEAPLLQTFVSFQCTFFSSLGFLGYFSFWGKSICTFWKCCSALRKRRRKRNPTISKLSNNLSCSAPNNRICSPSHSSPLPSRDLTCHYSEIYALSITQTALAINEPQQTGNMMTLFHKYKLSF